jgi:hypothetical protein
MLKVCLGATDRTTKSKDSANNGIHPKFNSDMAYFQVNADLTKTVFRGEPTRKLDTLSCVCLHQ